MKKETIEQLQKIAGLICEVRNLTDELLSDVRDNDPEFNDDQLQYEVLFSLENAETEVDHMLEAINGGDE